MGQEEKPQVGRELVPLAVASRLLAKESFARQDWSGLPIPVPGLPLVLEPRYKHKALENFRWKECYDENGVRQALEEEPPSPPSEYVRVNTWWSARHQVYVVVLKNKQGRTRVGIEVRDKLAFTIRTLEAAAAWPIEAEEKAQKKLASLVPADVYEVYLLTGVLPEISRRSRVTYLFRKGRPTIALRQDGEGTTVLCALCLHPIGYYGETWAGVMCPTDEVIAHLLMMRGSEEKYWANANQHPVDEPAAGL